MEQRRVAVLCVAAVVSAFAMSLPAVTGQAAIEQRIARVEGHLLPGIVVKGGPDRALTIADRMRFSHTPGVSVAVVNDGAIEWARAYGVLEAGTTERATPRTRFQAASISKPVTAMAALRLVQDGRLSLDEDVNAKLTS
jgi:CubicO group peptidase (beta-lactamase class C family)